LVPKFGNESRVGWVESAKVNLLRKIAAIELCHNMGPLALDNCSPMRKMYFE